MPGAPVQYDGVERFEQERPDLVDIVQTGHGQSRRGHHDDGRYPAASAPGCGWRAGRAPRNAARPALLRTSSRWWAIRLTWASPQANSSTWEPSDGSVSSTGSQPKGAHVSRRSGFGTIWRTAPPIIRTARAPSCDADHRRRLSSSGPPTGRGPGPTNQGDHTDMDVRNIEDVAPVVEHNGTVPVWWMVNSREMKDMTDGGFLELVNEFEVAGGGYVDPHSHPTHEFYYVLRGRGTMTDRRRRPAHRPGRPGPHPAGRRPQPAPDLRPCVDPLLLLRHRGQGRWADRLHAPLGRSARVSGRRRPVPALRGRRVRVDQRGVESEQPDGRGSGP